MKTVIFQSWIERERGWGMRPDGFTIHRTEADRQAYVKRYWDSMPDSVPESYSSPDGSPVAVSISEPAYAMLEGTELGVAFWANIRPEELDEFLIGRLRDELKTAVKEVEAEKGIEEA